MTWSGVLASLGLVGLATLIGFTIGPFLHPVNLVMLYLIVVVISAFFLGRGPSMLASLVSVLAFDYFFVDPRLSFSVVDTEYLVTFSGLLVVGLVISGLASQVRDQVRALQVRESQAEALNALSRDLTVALDLDSMLQAVISHVSKTLSREAVLLLPDGAALQQRAASPGFSLGELEQAAAHWSYEHAEMSGRGTASNPDSLTRFIPLKTARGVEGILGVRPGEAGRYLTQAQRQLLESFANLAALAVERARLAEQANQARLLRETEKLQTALLNSISHDLRTPLVSIQGVLESLLEVERGGESSPQLDRVARVDLLENAREETARLNRLVGNLLDMTRLESGALKLRMEPVDLQDVIGSALAALNEPLGARPVKVELAENLPMLPMDFVLMEQVVVNLVENAVKYSPPGAPLEIAAFPQGEDVHVRIADRGAGFPPEDLERMFDKFYRGTAAGQSKGTGLGLSICKGIVEAHGGRIWAENRSGGGAAITFSLPASRQEGV
jgi:two-component system sensor histidine kinase KdpD